MIFVESYCALRFSLNNVVLDYIFYQILWYLKYLSRNIIMINVNIFLHCDTTLTGQKIRMCIYFRTLMFCNYNFKMENNNKNFLDCVFCALKIILAQFDNKMFFSFDHTNFLQIKNFFFRKKNVSMISHHLRMLNLHKFCVNTILSSPSH